MQAQGRVIVSVKDIPQSAAHTAHHSVITFMQKSIRSFENYMALVESGAIAGDHESPFLPAAPLPLAAEPLYEMNAVQPPAPVPSSSSSDGDSSDEEIFAAVERANTEPHETANKGMFWYREDIPDEVASKTYIPSTEPRFQRPARGHIWQISDQFHTCLVPPKNGGNIGGPQPPPPAVVRSRPAPVKKRAAPAPEPNEEPAPKKARKEAPSAPAPSLPPPPPVMTAQQWGTALSHLPPLSYVHTENTTRTTVFPWTHANAACLLWALREGNRNNVLLKQIIDHQTPLAAVHKDERLVSRMPGTLERLFRDCPPNSDGVRQGQAALTTVYAFFQLFTLPKVPSLEGTPIFMAEALHGLNDEIGLLFLQYRTWIKAHPIVWDYKADTVAKARVAVDKYKAAYAVQAEKRQRAPAVPADDDIWAEEGAPRADAMDLDEAQPAAQLPELELPAAEPIELPTSQELDQRRFCEIVLETRPSPVPAETQAFVLRHAETLFAVRTRPPAAAITALMRECWAFQVQTLGRTPGGDAAALACLKHVYAQVLLAMCLVARAAQPKEARAAAQAEYHRFDWLDLGAYGGPLPEDMHL